MDSGRPGIVLCWAIKDTFIQYVTRSPGTQVSVGGGAGYADTGEFTFPAAQPAGARAGDAGETLRFEGDVRFVAHHGLLHVELADPWIQMQDQQHATLSLVHAERDAGPVRVTLARLAWQVPAEPDRRCVRAAASACLLPDGRRVFDDVYPAGELLAPVRVVAAPAS